MYEFFMEQSSIDFRYIFSLKFQHSPQGSGLNLYSCYSKHNYTRPSSDSSSSVGILGGETREKLRRIEVTVNILFFLVKCLDVPPAHTHKLTSCPLPLYFRNIQWITFTCFSLTTRCQKFEVRSVSLELRVETDWLECAAPQTKVTLLASRYQICHTIVTDFLFKPHTCNNGC